MPFRWNIEEDTALCVEVSLIRPETREQWEEVAGNLNRRFSSDTRQTNLTGRACRERTNRLTKKFKQDDRKSLKRSGTDEELTELMELLEDIITYERDCSLIKEVEKLSASKKKRVEKEQGEHIRKAAMERLSKKRRSNESDDLDASILGNSSYYEGDGEEDGPFHVSAVNEKENLKPSSPKKTRGTIKSTIQVFASQFEKKAGLKEKELELKRLELEFQQKNGKQNKRRGNNE